MKRISSTVMLFVISVFMIFYVNGLDAQINILSCAQGLTGESKHLRYRLHQQEGNVYLYDQQDLMNGRNNFTSNFHYLDNHTAIANRPYPMTLNDISTMLRVITQFVEPNGNVYQADQNYSALQMYYGMENQEMVIVFEPIYLVQTSKRSCRKVETGVFFKLGSNGFSRLETRGEMETLISTYQSSVRIRHVDTITDRFIIKGDMNDPLNDTKSSIMPLQQILKMYCDNLNGVEANLNDRIYFEIIADDHYLSSSESKLHVIATYNWGITTEDGVSYKGLAADFAQLCPINCDNIGINYYRMMNVLGRIFKL